MFKYPFIYKTINGIIEKEEVVANPWYCFTTQDNLGKYHSYPIGDIDNDKGYFTHIILAYKFLKDRNFI